MSLTTYDSLKLENLTPDQIVASNDDQILIDGSIRALPYGGGLEVSGDLVAEDVIVNGTIQAAGTLSVNGSVVVSQDVTFTTFAGTDVRPIVADTHGKLLPGNPEVQQVFAHYASAAIVPPDGDPLALLPSGENAERGSLVIPSEWWETGKRLTLMLVFEWEKQTGTDNDLSFWIDLAPGYGDPCPLASIPLSPVTGEGLTATGSGVLELDLQVGDMWGCGDTLVELFGTYRFNNSLRGRFEHLVPFENWEIRGFAQFANVTGTNSITVHAASVMAYEQPPYTSMLNA